jgi:hypothetical protein
MDKSLAAHYYKLSVDQRFPLAHPRYESILEELSDLEAQ